MASVVDIFCGAGGLTHGFIKAGFQVVAGIDNDATCRYAYEFNNNGSRFVCSRLEDITSEEISNYFNPNEIKIIVGCAPCQPFSSYSRRYDSTTFEDKWHLVETFTEHILAIQPEIVSMENVPALVSSEIYLKSKELLSQAGYHISQNIVYAPDYGVPQSRRRLVVLASRLGEIGLIPPTHQPDNYPTVQQVIGMLSPLQAGQIDSIDPLHRSRNLSAINLQRIQQSIPGGTWQDWDEELLADCHKRETGQSYQSVYGRIRGDQPGPTITTQAYAYGSGRFGHYDPLQHRALSLREIALLQTFPENYQFVDPQIGDYTFTRIGRQLGNAVPVRLAEAIAQSIMQHLKEFEKELI